MGAVPMKKTALNLEQARLLIIPALERHEVPVTQSTVTYALATFALENAKGESLYNYNWGNVSTSDDKPGVNYWRPTWFKIDEDSNERIRNLHQRMLEGKTPSAFLALENHDEGAYRYIGELYARRPSVLAAAEQGDLYGYARAVHDTAYCPDKECEPDRVIDSYRSLVAEIQPLVSELPGRTPPAAKKEPHLRNILFGFPLLGIGWAILKRRKAS